MILLACLALFVIAAALAWLLTEFALFLAACAEARRQYREDDE